MKKGRLVFLWNFNGNLVSVLILDILINLDLFLSNFFNDVLLLVFILNCKYIYF